MTSDFTKIEYTLIGGWEESSIISVGVRHGVTVSFWHSICLDLEYLIFLSFRVIFLLSKGVSIDFHLAHLCGL